MKNDRTMRHLGALSLCLALAFVFSSAPAPAQFYPAPTSGTGTTYTAASPLPALSGGVGLYAPPISLAGIGGTDFIDGDSISAGSIGVTSCSGTSASPSGTCYADRIAIFHGAAEINKAISGTCLEATTTSGSGCNNASSLSLIQRYSSDFATLTAGMRLIVMIGMNDVNNYVTSNDTQVSVATFRANLTTVLAAGSAIVGPKNVYVGEITYGNGLDQSVRALFNSAIAQVVEANGYNLAPTADAIQRCAFQVPSDTSRCLYAANAIHPNDSGSIYIAQAFEGANYQTAVAAEHAEYVLHEGWLQLSGPYATVGNTGAGFNSLAYNLTGSKNTAFGYGTCHTLIAQSNDTCIGYNSGALSTATQMTAVGSTVLPSATGNGNTCVGSTACTAVTSGGNNVGVGANSLLAVTTGQQNTAMGTSACSTATGTGNTCVGFTSTVSAAADTNETVLGTAVTGGGSNTVTLGNASVTKIASTGYVVPTNGFSDPGTTCANRTSCRVALAAGTYTWTFAPAWTNIPSCTVNEESTTAGHTAAAVPTTTSVVITSLTTAGNTDFVDVICVGRNG